jgi:hypothetical protein
MSDEFKVIETQEQLNEIIENRLKRDRESQNKKYEGYLSPDQVAELKAGYDKQITDLNNTISSNADKYAALDRDIAERDAKIKSYETTSVKSRIAHEYGLPYDAIQFLQGEDEETIKQSAENLKGLVGTTSNTPAPVKNLPEIKGDSNATLMKTLQSLRE